MKTITENQIDKAINEAMLETSNDLHQEFVNKINELPSENQNPYNYAELCMAFAINKSSQVMSNVLKQLLVD